MYFSSSEWASRGRLYGEGGRRRKKKRMDHLDACSSGAGHLFAFLSGSLSTSPAS